MLDSKKQTVDALYYPFSRCLSDRVIKQYLLLFDSITFLDPVEDDGWRSQLYKNIEGEDSRYSGYRDLADAMPWLRREGLIRIHAPQQLGSIDHEVTVAATFRDLDDHKWILAANPETYGLATQRFQGQPSWNVFRPKIPSGVITAFAESEIARPHLLYEGDDNYAWHLSYAAGSSIGINVHLAAAEELSLAPVTDSRLHHHLMLQKLQRGLAEVPNPAQTDRLADALATRTIFNVIERIMPGDRLDELPLEEILRFREETRLARKAFIDDVRLSVHKDLDPIDTFRNEKLVSRVTGEIIDHSRKYGAELQSIRNSIWPKLMGIVTSPSTATGSIAALAASYISGSAYVLGASALIPAINVAKAFSELSNKKQHLDNSSATSLAYLSRVGELA